MSPLRGCPRRPESWGRKGPLPGRPPAPRPGVDGVLPAVRATLVRRGDGEPDADHGEVRA